MKTKKSNAPDATLRRGKQPKPSPVTTAKAAPTGTAKRIAQRNPNGDPHRVNYGRLSED